MGKKKKNKAKRRQEARENAERNNTQGMCEHGKLIQANEVKKCVNKLKFDNFKCKECGEDWDAQKLDQLWICMTCGHLGCSRSMKAHSLEHHKQSEHPIFCSSEGQVWCHCCDKHMTVTRNLKKMHRVIENFKGKVRQFSNKLKKARLQAEKRQFEPVFVDKHVDKGSDEAPIVGLRNQGNTCYFNSIMQNLAEARCMRSAFASVKGPTGKMKKALSKFIEDMWTTRDKSITPSTLLDTMASYNSNLKGRRQQDAYECFQSITRGLEAESAKKKESNEKKKAKQFAGKVVETWSGKEVLEWLESYDVNTKAYREECEIDCIDLVSGEDLGPIVAMGKGQKKAAAQLFKSDMGFKSKGKNWSSVVKAWNDLKIFKGEYYDLRVKEYLENQKDLNLEGEDGSSEEENASDGERFDDISEYKPKEVLQHVFGGLLDSSVRCLNCDHVSRHYEKFYDLSLPIEPAISEQTSRWGKGKKNKKKNKRTKKGKARKNKNRNAFDALMGDDDEDEDEEETKHEASMDSVDSDASKLVGQARLRGKCSITDCLMAFTDPDLLFGDNAYRCIQCTKRVFPDYDEANSEQEMIQSPAHVRYQIARPPRILAIHLKRFTNHGFRTQKCGKKVEYPFELDLNPYMSDATKEQFSNTKYHLYGVSVHQGGMNGGHYIAYVHKRRSEGEENGWYYFSDATCRTASHKSAMNAQAYMLFYEQVNGVDTWEDVSDRNQKSVSIAEDKTAESSSTREEEKASCDFTTAASFSSLSNTVQGDLMPTINSFLGGTISPERVEFETDRSESNQIEEKPSVVSADAEPFSSLSSAVQGGHLATINSFLDDMFVSEDVDVSATQIPVDSEWTPGLYQILEDSYVMPFVDPAKSPRDTWMELEMDEVVEVSDIVMHKDRIRGNIPEGWITMYKISSDKCFAKKIDDQKEISEGDGKDEIEAIIAASQQHSV